MVALAEPALDVRPQPGPQERYLSSPADIAIYGGAAGGGKTWALLMEPLRHVENPAFGAVIFRRTYPQITNEGGLWDESQALYPLLEADPKESTLEWVFPSGARVKFGHMQYEKDKFSWKGAQIPLIGFDQLEDFTESQFFYMLSRNRSTSGVRPYVRANCNPDADSWLASFLSWWIDQDTGYPIPERSGAIRWFVRVSGDIVWGDSKDELRARYPDQPPKSVTFVGARLEDNPALERVDPAYRGWLMALPLVDRERLLGGNWKIRPTAGTVFQRQWFEIVPAAPAIAQRVRAWDKAATEAGGDWTAGVRMAKAPNGVIYIEDVQRKQLSPGGRDRLIRQTAELDGRVVKVRGEQEPGAAGKSDALAFVQLLQGFTVRTEPATGDKVTRAGPLASQAEVGNVKLVRGEWNEAFLSELERFPDGANDDQVDAASAAYDELNPAVRARSGYTGMSYTNPR